MQTIQLACAAPTVTNTFVADAFAEQTYVTIAATSSTVAKRLMSELGRTLSKNSFSTCSWLCPACFAIDPTKSFTPSDAVGPGKTALQVTPVPAQVSAIPRATAICAVFVTP